MAINEFKPKKYEDHEIVDGERKKVGTVRVKPSGILWKPKGSHSWVGVDIGTFADFMTKKGKSQKK